MFSKMMASLDDLMSCIRWQYVILKILTPENKQLKHAIENNISIVVMVTRTVIEGDRPKGSCSRRDCTDSGSYFPQKEIK